MYTQTRQPGIVESAYLLGGSVVWNNPEFAQTEDGIEARATLPPDTITEALWARNFGFNIPSAATIAEIVLTVRKRQINLLEGGLLVSGDARDYSVKLTKYGLPSGADLALLDEPWPNSLADVDYSWLTIPVGGSEIWNPAEINSSGFGAALAATFWPSQFVYDAYLRVDAFSIDVKYFYAYDHTASGGTVVFSVPAIVDPEMPEGGSIGGSASDVAVVYESEMSSGTMLDGTATTSYTFTIEGGISVDGTAENSHNPSDSALGGIGVGGDADIAFLDIVDIGGDVLVGGNSPSSHFYATDGGALAYGDSSVLSETEISGSVLVGGDADITSSHNEPREGVSVAVLVGGTSERNSTRNFYYEGDGDVVLGTVTNYGIIGSVISASGGLYVSNVLSPTIANFRFFKDTTFEWQTRAFVRKDISFLWNTGQLTMYWYRIIGEGRQGDECDLVADPCCQKFVMNVHARTVAELCEKLSERHWNWPIQSIQRFSRPATTAEAQYYIDENGECNELEEIPFCQIPQCADYCVDLDLKVTFNFSMRGSVNAFLSYRAGDGTAVQNSVFVGGVADAILDKNLPDYHYNPIENEIHLSSETLASPDYFAGQGGAILYGQANIGFPRHSYVGGEWPNSSDVGYGFTGTTDPLQAEGLSFIPWNYPENAVFPDGNNTELDISFGRTTEFLIVKGFNFQLPHDINILGFKVQINRWSTQVGVRDLSVYLINDETLISNNLAKLALRWPLIPTTTEYGSDSLDGLDPFVPLDGTWDVSIINGSNFGVAIQAEDYDNLPGSFAYVDFVNIQIFYESNVNQIIRIGGESQIRSENYNHEAVGGISVSGDGGPYHVERRYLPNGIGETQPTTFEIGGSHAIKLYYEVADENYIWVDSGNPVDEGNTGDVAYYGSDATSLNKAVFTGGGLLGAMHWQHPDRALIGDTNYTYCRLDLPYYSELLVVRNFGLSLDEHFKIHGIRVFIANRFSVKQRVYDTDLYLVQGNSFISDNLAKNEIWSTSPETVVYGSTGFDDQQQFRDTELNPWEVSEINDPTFGIALGVASLDASADVYAKVDTVVVEFTIEAFSRIQTYTAHVNMIGSATIDSDYRESTGGTSVGGFAIVKPYWDTMQGGIVVEGSSGLVDHYTYTTDGTEDIIIGGEATTAEINYSYLGLGGAAVSGQASISSNRFDYYPDGNIIFALGGADFSGTTLQSTSVSIGGRMVVIALGGIYSEYDENSSVIEPLVDTLSSCGCLAVPLTISLRHNIDIQNILAKFLVRNNLYLDNDLTLYYNAPNDSWQHNAHYVGLSADANTREKWDLVFDLQCTEEMGGVNIGRKIWKLGISVFRKNLTTGEDYDTRIIFGVMPEAICDTNANELDFKATYNTQLDFSTISPENAIIYQATLYDNIGLFKNQYWVNNPDIVISVSQSGFGLLHQRYDLYGSVTQPDEAVPVPSS